MSELSDTFAKLLSAETITVYLDDFALLNAPGLTDISHPRINFWVSPGVLKRMSDPNNSDMRIHWVRKKFSDAIDGGRIKVMPVDLTGLNLTPNIYGPAEDIFAHVVTGNRDSPNDIKIVVSHGDYMKDQASQIGVIVLDVNEFRQLLDEIANEEAEKEKEEQRVRRRKAIKIAIQIPLGLALAGVGIAVWRNLDWILRFVNQLQILQSLKLIPIVALVCLIGAFLYHCRGRWKFSYGLAEIIFGCYSVATSFSIDQESSSIIWDSVRLLGGLYVIVRGFDNIGKSLEGTPWDKRWRKFSREPVKSK